MAPLTDSRNPETVSEFDKIQQIHAQCTTTRFGDVADSTYLVDFKGLDIVVGEETKLIDHANLKIARGYRYGLVGRNGTGKSTLFQTIAHKLTMGVNEDIRMLYISQDEGGEEVSALAALGKQISVVESVLEGNLQLRDVKKEISLLNAATEAGDDDPETLWNSLRELEAFRWGKSQAETRKLIQGTSGFRGWQNRMNAVEAEDTHQLETGISSKPPTPKSAHQSKQARAKAKKAARKNRHRGQKSSSAPSTAANAERSGSDTEDEANTSLHTSQQSKAGEEYAPDYKPFKLETVQQAVSWAHEQLQLAYEQLQLIEGDPEEDLHTAHRILRGLGFTKARREGPLSHLSGGWKVRAALARALFAKPDLLLLDEPTNHLDLPTVVWLQKYLVEDLGDASCMLISHDRSFLNCVVDNIIILQNRKLEIFPGNYEDYLQITTDQKKHRARQRDSLARARKHMEASIAQGKRIARKTGDDKKAQMAATRQKKLDERFGIEVNHKGHRFKLNRDRAGYHNDMRDDVADEFVDKAARMTLPIPNELRGASRSYIEVQNVWFKYPSNNDNVLEDVTLNISAGDRIGIVGANGAGKSSLMNLLAETLRPSRGSINRLPQANLGYFDQHDVEKLRYDPKAANKTPYDAIMEAAPQFQDFQVREILGNLGIQQNALMPLATLSGGQLTRVALALATIHKPQILLLDEPTNHLDADSIEVLADVLAPAGEDGEEPLLGKYCAVVFVSHDVAFVNEVATSLFMVKKRHLTRLRDIDEYLDLLLARKK
eukprot:Clim_evm1s27 gene=Clim_evmTU1s27